MLHPVTNQLNLPTPQLRKGAVKVDDALASLLKLTPVRNFVKKWEDEEAPGIFANHAKRYILALRPDSGISFHETDRYKNPRGNKSRKGKKPIAVDTPARRDPATFIEVGVFATRKFKKGEVVNLRGGIADLTEEEDDEMRDSGGRRDFSVLWSERKNCFCLLLGPARFVNHDCRNNVEFQLVGANMTFKVLEDIAKDEEIFTHYGEPARLSGHHDAVSSRTCLQATTTSIRTMRRACARPARSESGSWRGRPMHAGSSGFPSLDWLRELSPPRRRLRNPNLDQSRLYRHLDVRTARQRSRRPITMKRAPRVLPSPPAQATLSRRRGRSARAD